MVTVRKICFHDKREELFFCFHLKHRRVVVPKVIIGSLPKPTFNVNANGKVVVRITVNGNGQVIAAEPTSGTTISNQTVRSAAVEAAKKARFAVKEGAGNVTGTITYYFDSNN